MCLDTGLYTTTHIRQAAAGGLAAREVAGSGNVVLDQVVRRWF
jgi:hypothetical protein